MNRVSSSSSHGSGSRVEQITFTGDATRDDLAATTSRRSDAISMKSMHSTGGETQFLNVDLELVTRVDLSPLLAHWRDTLILLRDSTDAGCRTIWAELRETPRDANSAIDELTRNVKDLPGPLRALWDACDDRCFNVGVQAGRAPHATAFPISAQTIAALTAIAARLEFTVYGIDDAAGRRRPRGSARPS